MEPPPLPKVPANPTPASLFDARDRSWKRAGLAGAGVALIAALVRSGHVSEADLLWTPFWIIAAWAVAMLVPFARARRALRMQPGLLVPAGIALGLETLLSWLYERETLRPVFGTISTVGLWKASVGLSLPFFMNTAFWSAYAAWQTDLLLRSVAHADPPALAPWEPIRRGFWRAFAALFIGHAGILVLSLPFLEVFESSHALFVVGMMTVSVLYNLATTALLPVMIMSPEPFLGSLKAGFRQSWARKRSLFLLVVLHLGLLGFATYFTARWNNTERFGWSIHSLWEGGYWHSTHWYGDHQGLFELPRSPFAVTLLSGLFLVLAVAMRLTVIRKLIVKTQARAAEEIREAGPAEAAVRDEPAMVV